MLRKLIPITLLAVIALMIPHQKAFGQFTISNADTFKVQDTFGQPGDVVPIKLYVANHTATMLGVIAYFSIDTNVVRYVGVEDQGNFYVNAEPIERGLPSPFDFQPLVMVTTDSLTSSLVGAGQGTSGYIAIGAGNIMQFYVRIRDDVELGTQTTIRVYHPFQGSGSDIRACQYSDDLGLTTVYPTVVSGTLTAGTNPNPQTNSPPVISALAQTSYSVDPGTNINFTVSANDPDAPQQITLSASGLPSGSSFGTGGQVTGAGFASGNFSWTPNASQTGDYSVVFSCVDDSSASAVPRSVSIHVNTVSLPEGDVLFTVSQSTLGPVSGGTPGLTGLTIPINLTSTQAVYGIQFDFIYNSDVLLIDSLVPTERLNNFTVYSNIGDTPGRVRVVAFGLNNEEIQTGATSAILNFWVTVRGSATIGESPIGFENAFEAISPDPFVASVPLEVDDKGVFVVDAGGDVNGDGSVDIADMVNVVGYIIGRVELNLRQFTAADMDRNGFVDVVDLQAIINQVFGGTSPSFSTYSGTDAVLTLKRPSATGSADAELYAELPTDVSGVQFEINYNPDKVKLMDPAKTGMSDKLSLEYRNDGTGKMVVLLYPGNGLGRYMAPGAGTLINVPIEQKDGQKLADEDLKIRYAVMVNPDASEIPVKNLGRGVVLPEQFSLNQNYPNPFNPQTTIEFAIKSTTPQRTRLEIFNLLGQHVQTMVDNVLPPGDYSYTWYGRLENGNSAPSGVYFYRLTMGDQAKTRKMVLLK